jgi:DNA methylase
VSNEVVQLSEQDRQLIFDCLNRGEPLPQRFRLSLFADAPEAELIWSGKTSQIERTTLPFQSIEQVDEPRSETNDQLDLFSIDNASGRQVGGWSNKLIWGDNKLVLSSLTNGPLRDEIEAAGGLKLIYIDPPFDVGADFSMDIEIGNDTVTKKANLLEEIAYRDTSGKGADSFMTMLNERLILMDQLMAQTSTIYIHLDWRTVHYVKVMADDIFGRNSFMSNVIGQGSPARPPWDPTETVSGVLLTRFRQMTAVRLSSPAPMHRAFLVKCRTTYPGVARESYRHPRSSSPCPNGTLSARRHGASRWTVVRWSNRSTPLNGSFVDLA